MAKVFADLKPALLWKHFEEILKIPRCSKSEKAMGDYVIAVAERNRVLAKRDKAGNVVIMKPASQGHENATTVVLQGHLDMVCEKNSDVVHDFSKDPIKARKEGEWITATGTTLGADNGIGMAAALAVLEDKTLTHGPLELLFTSDEETGLNGANNLKSGFLKGKILLNLDSEEEGAFFVGCAGGGDSEISLPVERKSSKKGKVWTVKISGMRGGHSGIDIHTGRGNAVQLLARMLYKTDVPFELISIEGGNKHNAIPREAFAEFTLRQEDTQAFRKLLQKRFKDIQFEYKSVEKDIAFRMGPGESAMKPMTRTSQEVFLGLLVSLPHGVMAMSQEIQELVETSNNLAIIRTAERKATLYTSTRSSVHSALEAVRTRIEAVARLAGAGVKHLEGYPPWTPNLKSPLLETMKSVYKKLYGKDPRVQAIHAGLECGIIGKKFPGMDMISFGPDLRNPHSPDERVHVRSVEKFWNLLTATLETLA